MTQGVPDGSVRSAVMGTTVCRECSATLAVTDRFCPACGTPNVEGKLHPKLPPALVEPETYLDLSAGPDEAPCPRCRRPIRDDDPYCRSCGLALDRSDDPWRDVAAAIGTRAVYRPVGSANLWLRWVTICTIVLAGVAAGCSLWLAAALRTQRVSPTADGADQVALLTDVRSSAVAALAGLGLLTAIVAVVWLRRAMANLPALGASPPRLRRGWVAPGLVVPVLNLVAPPLLLDEVWRGSDPAEPRLGQGRWRDRPAPVLLWMGWSVLVLFCGVLVAGATWDPTSDVLANDQFAATLDAVGFSVLLVAIILLLVAVSPLPDRQHERADRLGLLAASDASDPAGEPEAELAVSLHDGTSWGRY